MYKAMSFKTKQQHKDGCMEVHAFTKHQLFETVFMWYNIKLLNIKCVSTSCHFF